jgi:hypothetical protein
MSESLNRKHQESVLIYHGYSLALRFRKRLFDCHPVLWPCGSHARALAGLTSTFDFNMTFANALNVDARYGNFNAIAGDQYIIQQCFSQTSVPPLSKAFSSFKFIVRSVDQVKSSRRQLSALEYTIATLLRTLDAQYREEKLSKTATAVPLADLQR